MNKWLKMSLTAAAVVLAVNYTGLASLTGRGA